MTQICQVTGRRPQKGHTVSHANKKTIRRYNINLHNHRFWVEGLKQFIRLRVTARGMRIIDKFGIESVLKKICKYEKDISAE
jgi:large subunit ribosomal protein L28